MVAEKREPIVIVAGMGRCGTSLVMAMLEAAGGAGAPALGARPPGYELIALREALHHRPRPDYAWCAAAAGGAGKVIEPHRYPVPPAAVWPCRVIWLERADLAAQAQSWLQYRLRLAARRPAPAHALAARPRAEAAWLRTEEARPRGGDAA